MIEITSYVLGMLTIAAALLLIALVVGMVKISKLEKKISEHQKQFDIVYENMSRNDEYLRRLLDDTHREINMGEKRIMNQVQQIDQEHHKIEDEIHREIDQTKSYIDSRIDKVVLQGSIVGSKEIIKG
jgi:peptidoglycan hydrolase CwlO-like protein